MLKGSDVRLLGLDRARGGEDVVPALRLPVRRQPGLREEVLVVVERPGVGAHRDAVELAVRALARALRRLGELAPVGPLAGVVVERREVAGVDVGVDQERVLVEDVGRRRRRPVHQVELGVVVVLVGLDRVELDRHARVRGLVLGLDLGHVGVHLGEGAELLVGDRDRLRGAVAGAARAARAGRRRRSRRAGHPGSPRARRRPEQLRRDIIVRLLRGRSRDGRACRVRGRGGGGGGAGPDGEAGGGSHAGRTGRGPAARSTSWLPLVVEMVTAGLDRDSRMDGNVSRPALETYPRAPAQVKDLGRCGRRRSRSAARGRGPGEGTTCPKTQTGRRRRATPAGRDAGADDARRRRPRRGRASPPCRGSSTSSGPYGPRPPSGSGRRSSSSGSSATRWPVRCARGSTRRRSGCCSAT